MALINYPLKEMTIKIVYYGPGLSGKTTSLKYIYNKLPDKKKGKIVTLSTEGDRTFFFDFLPISAGKIGNFNTRIQLYTVPGQVFYERIRRMVLQGTDGIVFVADSQESALEANKESLSSLYKNLKVNNIEVDKIPIIFAYNKRDLPHILPVSVLNKELNPNNYPFFETSAITGEGVMETLYKAIELTFNSVKDRYKFQSESEREETIIFTGEDISREEVIKETPKKEEPVPEADFGAHDDPTINIDEIDEISPMDEFDIELDDSDIEEAKRILEDEQKVEKKEEDNFGEFFNEEIGKEEDTSESEINLGDTLIPDSKEIIKNEEEPIEIDKISELAEEFENEEEILTEISSTEGAENISISKEDIKVELTNKITVKNNQIIIPIEISVKDVKKRVEIKLNLSLN